MSFCESFYRCNFVFFCCVKRKLPWHLPLRFQLNDFSSPISFFPPSYGLDPDLGTQILTSYTLCLSHIPAVNPTLRPKPYLRPSLSPKSPQKLRNPKPPNFPKPCKPRTAGQTRRRRTQLRPPLRRAAAIRAAWNSELWCSHVRVQGLGSATMVATVDSKP